MEIALIRRFAPSRRVSTKQQGQSAWGSRRKGQLYRSSLLNARLAPNFVFIADLLEAGVELAAVDMTDANRFMLHMMTAVAEQEAGACSERTRTALAAAKARGVRLGGLNPKRKAGQKRESAKGAAANKRNTQVFVEGMIPMARECLYHGRRTSSFASAWLAQRGLIVNLLT